MNDIVYILRQGNNDELIYSVRSVVANFPFRKIWFYAGKPLGIRPDKAVYFNQGGFSKWKRVRNSVQMICQNEEITKNFWLFNDDFFVMKRIEKPTNCYDGTLIERIEQLHKSYDGSTLYCRQLENLYDVLKEVEPDSEPLNYAVHMPMLINREKMRDVLKAFPTSPMFRALYGNICHIGGENRKDCKFVADRQPWPIDLYASTTEVSFKYERIGEEIRKAFPKPSKYEVDNG